LKLRAVKPLLIITVIALGFFNAYATTSNWISFDQTTWQQLSSNSKTSQLIRSHLKGPKLHLAQVDRRQLNLLTEVIQQERERCGGFVLHSKVSNKKSATGLLEKLNKPTTPQVRKPQVHKRDKYLRKVDADYTINQQAVVPKWMEQVSTDRMDKTVLHLSSYKTRYYKAPEGVEAMKWIAQQWGKLTAKRTDTKIELYDHKDYPQPSVILTIKGSLDSVIILGGHGDSINTDDEGIHSHAPGADDNAAGIAVLTEILQLIVNNNYRPRHTIQFIAYAAEEVGIQGSYHLAKVYAKRRTNVIGVIQFDGVNYKGPSYDITLVKDYTSQQQNDFLASLLTTYQPDIKWRYELCGYGCSDHAAWNYNGYHASYPVESTAAEQNPYSHTAEDTFDKSGYTTDHAAIFAKLGVAYLLELD
jgi:bacterial leucyl aminopeptidase